MRITPSLLLLLLSLTTGTASGAEPLFENSGFESGTLANWTAQGEAFAIQPTKGDNPAVRGRESSWHDGEYWIGGYEAYTNRAGEPGDTRGDQLTGTLTSREFVVGQRYISFLVSGGRQPGKLGVRLKVGSEEVELATGNDSESLARCNADVSRFQGQRAQLIVFDDSTGQWGHINVDAFVASPTPLPDDAQQFAFSKSVRAESYDDIDYSEPLRPQFHFSSGRNWINDPNGMVYDGEKYHLFFQHNPRGTQWGNMTWGHATSPDMLHWTQLPHALLPYRVDGRSGTIYSGTVVVDHNNSLGVQQGDVPTLCAFFTFASQPRFYQAMAYSTDRGATWTYWNEGRPVVDNQGFDSGERDPKVFWHQPSKQWVMLLWVQQNPGRVRFFTSDNLTEWKFASDLMRDWAFECMDFVSLAVDGDPQHTKAVIYDASFDYEVGHFDGRQFHTEAGPYVAGSGNFYAAQTFANQPQQRAVQIGWMRGHPNLPELYGLPFNGQMTFPCELSLHTHADGPRLHVWPIKEIESLMRSSFTKSNVELSEGDNLLADVTSLDLVDLEIDFDPGTAEQIVFDLGHAALRYDSQQQVLKVLSIDELANVRETVAIRDLAPRDGSVKLRLLVDRLTVEAYAFGGEKFHACYYSPLEDDEDVSITTTGGTAQVHSFTLRQLKPAW
ncbi:glycoside hydrolase family 32 protein [Aeoliella sp. ICT_H6.2]|uniref:Glycoside hydrolase family 32 protein n=1 Tax=Aeoliella straminimaris TaxID=2954799 RepID=A0A9X2FFR3_9BACT|nr:glycoside hydrolase family 32 protein [Aeoliella straminimaris]MCO6047197.1 glycoside hydrolase family 32 protein [Aeoliella straminimaris]